VLEEFLTDRELTTASPSDALKLKKAVDNGLGAMIGVCRSLQLVAKPAIDRMNLIKLNGDRFAHDPSLRGMDDDADVRKNFIALQSKTLPGMAFSAAFAYASLGISLRYVIGHLGNWSDELLRATQIPSEDAL